ncbi:MAG: PilZ domain-containing protein [Pseudomonadales bacterium]
MATSLLMSKIIDLADARRSRRVAQVETSPRVDHENRKEYRKLTTERLFLQIVECPADPELVGTTLSCRTVDVSSGGLRIQSKDHIPEGCQLDLWVDNSARPGKFFLTSHVRWIRTVDGQYEIGVALHNGSATDIEDWRQLLSRF